MATVWPERQNTCLGKILIFSAIFKVKIQSNIKLFFHSKLYYPKKKKKIKLE